MCTIITVKELSKEFKSREFLPGFKGAIQSLLFSKPKITQAISQLSFSVKKGEKVAFIGPNGAGKSTTIKILTGILHPDSGSVQVSGLVPWKDKKALAYQYGTVFGQRTQLWPRLSPIETFKLLSKVYDLNKQAYQKWLEELIESFQIKSFLRKPVYQLSLGERMRCELVASLLHRPSILFLDEPTIGLDVNAKLIIRDMLNRLSNEQQMTLFLTSHDPVDIEQVCERALVIDQGKLVRDSSIRDLRRSYAAIKIVTLTIESKTLSLDLPGIRILRVLPYQLVLEIDLEQISLEILMKELLKKTDLKDLTIEDPAMEKILRNIYQSGKRDFK